MVIRRCAEISVPAAPQEVLAVLLQVAGLAEWNPAFSDVRADGPVVIGVPVPIRVQGILDGALVYDQVSSTGIDMTIRIPGLREHGSWRVRADGAATVVTHEFTQHGPLAVLLEPGTRNVADLRVGRLRDRLAERPPGRAA